jgi:predicted enzyme related to lactoylglutathione lyase
MRGAPLNRRGRFAWVDLATAEIECAIHFYERVFGWRYEEHDTHTGTYVVAKVVGGEVGGVMTETPAQVVSGARPGWMAFVGSEHLEADVARVRDLGGSVLRLPMSFGDGARVAVIGDPAGASLALLQSSPHESAMVWGQRGGVVWVECLSRNPRESRRFHEDLFGWKGEQRHEGCVVFTLDGEPVGGLLAMPDSVPSAVPSHWLVYFAVDNADAACLRAAQAGGTVLRPTHDVSEGRAAALQDPAGAVFAVFEQRAA